MNVEEEQREHIYVHVVREGTLKYNNARNKAGQSIDPLIMFRSRDIPACACLSEGEYNLSWDDIATYYYARDTQFVIWMLQS